MSIQSYPRTIVQDTGNGQITQNGLCLMIYNSTTNKYEAATAATFGGGGGGDATAANQVTQINLATTSDNYLNNIDVNITAIDLKTTKIQKYSQWNTFYAVSYNCGALGNTFNLVKNSLYPCRIVFREAGVIISSLFNRNAVDVTNDYFDNAGAAIIANNGTEIISIGNTTDDLFDNITLANAGHFTAYYMITPYVTP